MEYSNNDLNYRINLLYDYVYNKDNKKSYIFNKIKPDEITIDDIKIIIDDNDDIYNNYIKLILSEKIKLEYYDDDNFILYYKRYSNEFPTNIKISFYKDNESINALDNIINNDSLFSYLLSELVILKYTKHILLPIINIDISFNHLKNIMDNNIINKVNELLLNDKIVNICCLQIREDFFQKDILYNYLDKFYEEKSIYKPLLFQIIHTLSVINYNYNNFQHNNLLLKNIVIYIKKINDSYSEYYDNDNDKYYVPNLEFDIKFTNFEYAYIPNILGSKSNNKLNDLQMFILNLKELLVSKYNKDNVFSFDKELNNFIKKIMKNKNCNYDDLLKDNFFNEYLEKKTTDIIDNEYILGRNNFRIIKQELMYDVKIYRTNMNNSNVKRYLKQTGGDNNEQVPYKKDINNPFTTNEQKKINEKNYDKPNNNLLLEQKIYDTSKQPKQPYPSNVPLYPPEYPLPYPYNIMYPNMMNTGINQLPVQKVYNISLSNPLGNYTTLNRVFEDTLPGDPNSYTALTIYERLQLVNHIRNIMLVNCDGEEMTITGGDNSLLSYVKLMDINPYNICKNPYSDLSRNFLLYRGAYPIKYNKSKNIIDVAKQSMGLNIRMYMMSVGDFNCSKINKNIDSDDFDLWREIKYYDFIKNTVVKRKISPNFIIPILYKIDILSNIKWSELEQIKIKEYDPGVLDYLKKNQNTINNKHQVNLNNLLINLPNKKIVSKDDDKNNYNKKDDININSGKTLLLLTEAPNSSLIKWASALYVSEGTVKKMIATGYHSPLIWKIILFQLVYAMAVLQETGIYLNNLSLNQNFYIKDINYDTNSVGCWIYKIDDIDFYVPNYGYILMIDSKYNEIDVNFSLKPNNDDNLIEKEFKIYGKIFEKNEKFNLALIKEKIYEQFKNLIDPDNFSRKLQLMKGSKPDESIIDLFRKIHNDNSISSIRDYLIKYFDIFLHNRIGTPLYKSEQENTNLNLWSNHLFKKGQLLIYQERYNHYVWVLFLNDNNDGTSTIKIKISDSLVFQDMTVRNYELYMYPENEKIVQDNKKGMKFDENYVIETYNLDNIT